MPEVNAADTIRGKIFIGLVVALGSAAISWVVARATHEPPPPPVPSAVITPADVIVQANEVVEFSAAGSTLATDGPASYTWQVSGQEPNRSTVSKCSDIAEGLRCRFALPGTFSVSVTVRDANGQSARAASSVSVRMTDGYFGLELPTGDADAQRALLYDIDWVALQSLVTRPIVLHDPDTGAPVFALHVETPSGTPDPAPWSGKAGGLKMALPPLRPEAQAAFGDALSQIGIQPVIVPLADISQAQRAGAVDGGVVLLDLPSDLSAERE